MKDNAQVAFLRFVSSLRRYQKIRYFSRATVSNSKKMHFNYKTAVLQSKHTSFFTDTFTNISSLTLLAI